MQLFLGMIKVLIIIGLSDVDNMKVNIKNNREIDAIGVEGCEIIFLSREEAEKLRNSWKPTDSEPVPVLICHSV